MLWSDRSPRLSAVKFILGSEFAIPVQHDSVHVPDLDTSA
jgi:hypothetical protein